VSYFRSQKARKTGPRSITRLPNSTQKMSQEGGRVKTETVPKQNCAFPAGHLSHLGPIAAKLLTKTEHHDREQSQANQLDRFSFSSFRDASPKNLLALRPSIGVGCRCVY